MFIDSHCHLNFQKFKEDYKDVIKKAQDTNVRKIVNVGSNLKTSVKATEIAKEFTGICFASVGLHPTHVLDEVFDSRFEKLARSREVVAIGETGLDYFRISGGNESKEEQKKLFIKHLELAKKLNKPVILHCRDAYLDLLQNLKEFDKNKKLKKVLHCYDGNIKHLHEFLKLGCMISFTGNLTYGDTRDEAIKLIPTNLLMIETDAPYLAPVPYRGKKNQPAYVIEIAKYIARIKKIELVKLEKILQKNTEKLFNI